MSHPSAQNPSSQRLRIGDCVRVKHIDEGLISSLEGEERMLVESMIGQVLPVIEMVEDGFVVVEAESKKSEACTLVQSVCLSPLEYEVLP